MGRRWQGAAFTSQGPLTFLVLSGLWQQLGWEDMLVPWRQRPQAPVVGLTLDKSGVRQNGQTLISRIKFVGVLGCVYPLSVAQVLARTGNWFISLSMVC